MKIGVYSLQKVLFQGEASSVNCNTQMGEITLLDHHRPIISIMKKGTMKIVDKDGREHYVPVQSGILEMHADNQARFLVEEPMA